LITCSAANIALNSLAISAVNFTHGIFPSLEKSIQIFVPDFQGSVVRDQIMLKLFAIPSAHKNAAVFIFSFASGLRYTPLRNSLPLIILESAVLVALNIVPSNRSPEACVHIVIAFSTLLAVLNPFHHL